MAGEEIRIGRRVWVRDPTAAGGRSFGQIASILPRLLASSPPGFVVQLESKPSVITCAEHRRGEQWDFAD
jgi:hypothetical protein